MAPRAIEQLALVSPDLILLDAVMPGMDGFATCRALKAGPAPDVPIIFMTGLDETENVVRGLEAGGVDYLTKPIAPDELVARIRVHVANARRMSSARAALDAAGRALIAVDTDGRIEWHTPARGRIRRDAPGCGWYRAGVARCGDAVGSRPRAPRRKATHSRGRRPRRGYRLTRAPDAPARSNCSLAWRRTTRRQRTRLAERFQLTEREAEVLFWVARAKSIRDIGEILDDESAHRRQAQWSGSS